MKCGPEAFASLASEMHSISVTPQSHLPTWRGQGMNRLCLRWPSLPTMWRMASIMKPRKGLISLFRQTGCR